MGEQQDRVERAKGSMKDANLTTELHQEFKCESCRDLRARLADADEALVNWTHAAGWSTGHGDTLVDIINEMKSQHCDERSYADLRASGGLFGGDPVERAEQAEARERRLREVFESLSEMCWSGMLDAADFQDEMIKAGLFVEVPASAEIRAEYDTDTMFVLEWKREAGAEPR